jgi:calcium-dependent protein kinase
MLHITEEQVVLTNLAISNLKTFAAMNKLKKASLNVVATQLADSAIKDLKEMFLAMDENGDGTLTVGELKDGLERAGVAVPTDLQELMESIDTDGSGVIDYSEFLAATLDKRKYYQDDVCWAAFKVFDVDGSGEIDKEELHQLLNSGEIPDGLGVQVNEAEVNAIFAECDLNGDGKIDFDEFMAMMRKMPSNAKSTVSSPSGKSNNGDRSAKPSFSRSASQASRA